MCAASAAVENANRRPEWQAGLLRATAFCLAPPDLQNVKWWEELTGRPPESRNVRAGIGELIEQGLVENRGFQLQIHLARVDWIVVPKEEPEGDRFQYLGGFAESLPAFQALISKWLETAPPLNRLAFGAQLYIPSSSSVEAMAHLARMLRYVRIEGRELHDFVYQVNRRRPCVAWPDLGELNRLARWQAVLRKKVIATLLPEAQAPVPVQEELAAYLELDINTPPMEVRREIPREILRQIFAELISNGHEIADRGDAE